MCTTHREQIKYKKKFIRINNGGNEVTRPQLENKKNEFYGIISI